MKRTVKLGLCCAAVAAALGAAAAELPPYRPMVVEGNTWKYMMGWGRYIYHKQKPWELRIEGDTIINDREYKCLYAYYDYSDVPHSGVPYAFLREDCETRQVFCVANPEYDAGYIDQNWTTFMDSYEEVVLYDFLHPMNCKWFEEYIDDNFFDESVIEVGGEQHRCIYFDDSMIYSEGYLIEGIGGMLMERHATADLLGVYSRTPNGGDCGPYFHTFVDAAGQQTRLIPEHMPGYGIGDYVPMVEEGKSWHYTLKSNLGKVDTGHTRHLVLSGDTVVDGLEYKKLYSYSDNAPNPDGGVPRALLREDKDAWRVYCIADDRFNMSEYGMHYEGAADFKGEEVVLYDFLFPQFSVLLKYITDSGFDVLRLFLTYDGFGCHPGTMIAGSSLYWDAGNGINLYTDVFDRHVVGVGQTRANSETGRGDLLNYYGAPAETGDCVIPYLYAVTDAGGNEIFTIEENRPMGGVEAVETDEGDAEPEYFNLHGVRVEKPAEGHLYIVRRGDRVSKQLYR